MVTIARPRRALTWPRSRLPALRRRLRSAPPVTLPDARVTHGDRDGATSSRPPGAASARHPQNWTFLIVSIILAVSSTIIIIHLKTLLPAKSNTDSAWNTILGLDDKLTEMLTDSFTARICTFIGRYVHLGLCISTLLCLIFAPGWWYRQRNAV